MTFKSFLEEKITGQSVVISVDIQPVYQKACKYILPKYINFINRFKGKLILFFNDEDIGCDSQQSVSEWLIEHGVDEDTMDRIIWKPKQYAFFRNWMDRGMSRGHLIKAIRYMVMHGINDSRDVEEEVWKQVFGGEKGDWNEWTDIPEIVMDDMISIPDINIAELKSYQHVYLCGGGKDECLAEIEILLNAFNIKYTEIKSLIY